VNVRRIELDYIAPPRRGGWLGLALLAAALALAAQQAIRYRDLVQERTALAARIELEHEHRTSRPGSARRTLQETRDAEAVLRQLALPWPQMIESVESTASRQVALLGLQPEPERGLLRLTAEAGTPQAMLDYMRRLGDSPALSGVHLVSHRVEPENLSHPVQFVAMASLRAAK
jgi:hypothetical protein